MFFPRVYCMGLFFSLSIMVASFADFSTYNGAHQIELIGLIVYLVAQLSLVPALGNYFSG